MDELELISANIKQLREKKGLSRKELALAIHITHDYLKKIEQGHKAVDSISFLKQIADGLGSPPLLLLPRSFLTANLSLEEAREILFMLASEFEELKSICTILEEMKND